MNACTANIETDIPNGMARIAGQINSWTGEAVESVNVSIEKEAYQTPVTGFYHFDVPMHEDYTITPIKDTHPLNGVSTFDLVLISKHILGIQPFEQPYQWIAADVNRSNTITAFDIVQLRKLILAIDKEFTNNTSWRFIPTDYEMNRTNPLASNLDESYEIPNLSNHQLVDYIGVKIGDVNGNAKVNSFHRVVPRTSPEVFTISTKEQSLNAGQLYDILVTTEQLAQIEGYQFTLQTDKVQIEKVTAGIMQLEHFGQQGLSKGTLTASWNQQTVDGRRWTIDGRSHTKDKVVELFTLQLLVMQDTKLSEVLSLKDRPTPTEAYDALGNSKNIRLRFTPSSEQPIFELYQNEPNPFFETTTIRYTLPAAAEAILLLRDEAGRIIQTIYQDGKAGENEIQIREKNLPTGFIYYQLTTKFGSKSRKMLRLK